MHLPINIKIQEMFCFIVNIHQNWYQNTQKYKELVVAKTQLHMKTDNYNKIPFEDYLHY